MTRTKRTAERIPFQMHPRVFAALGADLVTNDIVAVIELVKNSYDAFGTRVDVRFGSDKREGPYLEVEDDGHGMDLATIESVWCVVATPFRMANPNVTRGQRVRRAAGEKGLGRLSAARLGMRLEMLTQSEGNPCWQVKVDWSALADAKDLASCSAEVEEFRNSSPFATSGTRVRIYKLSTDWDESRIDDLGENLARLVSPFAQIQDFAIHLTGPKVTGKSVPLRVEAPAFLSHPKYAIRGQVDAKGGVKARYKYSPLDGSKSRRSDVRMSWGQIKEVSGELAGLASPGCGPFSFEIFAWDIASDDTAEIAERFDLTKSSIRKVIRAHKGISVYRDAVLVLPKSEESRDWLGLDLRRVSKTGTRLSTSQLVGYVAISAKKNPKIEDTSDRERLASNPEVTAFQGVLKVIVQALEVERDIDRRQAREEKAVIEIFEELSAEDLLAEVMELADEGLPAEDALPSLRAHAARLEKARRALEQRFTYYSRLATVGTIALMLVHEIRNRTTAFGYFIRRVQRLIKQDGDVKLTQAVDQATRAVDSLEQLADRFAPLASRSFRRGKRDCVIEESIQRCLGLVAGDLKKTSIAAPVKSQTKVAVDPGELDAIILNLLTNAAYWLKRASGRQSIEFQLSRVQSGRRVRCTVHDSGPGVAPEDVDKVFWPGITRKPGGIGMGLTVAAELVSAYGGTLGLRHPGKLGGASFFFDLPVKK